MNYKHCFKKTTYKKPYHKPKVKFQTHIVKGQVFKIDLENLYVRFNHKIGICSLKHVSDFHERIPLLIKLNNEYAFLVVGFVREVREITKSLVIDFYWKLMYKPIHPEEISRKSKPIPTVSNFTNLLQDFQKQLTIENVPTAKSQNNIIDFKFVWKKMNKENSKSQYFAKPKK